MQQQNDDYVIGVDFGTDSVRAVLMSTGGELIGEAVENYARWTDGRYSDPSKNRFRQHPQDYLDGMTGTIRSVLNEAGDTVRSRVKALSADTTGSTPVAVDKKGRPLALHPDFEDNPDAMFILWKDHTAIQEAEEINKLASAWKTDYTKYVGGIYSSEWFWAKILHTLRNDEKVRKAVWSWAEHCDWIPFELTGGTDVRDMKRSRCAAGHKAMWHESFDGLPDQKFLSSLDPMLDGIRDRMYRGTWTADRPAGTLSPKWADILGLSKTVIVGVGAFDAHMGAVGGEIEPYHLSKVMGTSTCDMLIAPYTDIEGKLIRGICGQVDGSVVPGLVGLEAGQSAFGDCYAWFRDLLLWPLKNALQNSDTPDSQTVQSIYEHLSHSLIRDLERAAADHTVADDDHGLIALDWLNGRRTPDANQKLTSAVDGLNLGINAPDIYRALVEATCFGAKAIVDRFTEEGIPIHGIIGMGGVAKKSGYVMQTLTNVLNMPIRTVASEQTCALGAGMFAATAAGLFPKVEDAMKAMGSGFDETYLPQQEVIGIYKKKYERYLDLARHVENRTTGNPNQG